MYNLTVSVGLGSRHSLTGASGSGSLAGFNQKAVSHLQVCLGVDLLPRLLAGPASSQVVAVRVSVSC